MNIKNIFVLSHLTNMKSEDIRNKKLNIGIQICNTWCILFEYIRATKNTFDEPPPPWSKFSTSFIHICADLGSFCCLLSIGRIRISNIFETRKLSIRIRICNIRCLLFEYIRVTLVILRLFLKDKYHIYVIVSCGPFTNILGEKILWK